MASPSLQTPAKYPSPSHRHYHPSPLRGPAGSRSWCPSRWCQRAARTPVHSIKSIGKHQASGGTGTGVAPTGVVPTGAQTGTHPIATGGHHNNGTGTQTGSHPIVTGTHNNGTQTGGKNSTIIGTGTAPCFSCHGSATIPVYVPTKTASGGASPSGGAGGVGGSASPSSTEYTPSSPGSKVTAPQVGVLSAVIGSIVYGAVMLLA
ncbi:uncharacterized protein N7487_009229 [Penicillium crustosum]|uniref:uncharacterized protein n=1 Tax=Penicillium crustosum TaxID=36656 RepID=UPI00239F8C59|nr:uncharacterized protein N7487_009229 [Penicillium crustosum]KAJ5394926.1 hypothetical protein N7487_009229 [Penicillium crustosum]